MTVREPNRRWRASGTWIAHAALIAASALIALALLADTASAAHQTRTTWLCKPGMSEDPCRSSEETTVEYGNGETKIEKARPRSQAPIDCFYVYPTVSEQPTANANLEIEQPERQVAIDQASRFSQVCKVYAPMYPQLTIGAELEQLGTLGTFKQEDVQTAYAAVLAAWHEYLAKYNHGRGVVLIGHSQGAGMLRKLIKEEVDPNESQRKLLVSALLMGGNVSVPEGKLVGGDFQNIPECQAAYETHCVVAYSTFLQQPPADSLFGTVEGPVAALGGGAASGADLQVMCVNPTLLVQNGGVGDLLPYEATTPIQGAVLGYGLQAPKAATPWVATPGQYTAQCMHSGDDTWLQATDVGPVGDPREVIEERLGPTFGLHIEDINLALGNLVKLVGIQAQVYGFES
jgi:hypothetical protein